MHSRHPARLELALTLLVVAVIAGLFLQRLLTFHEEGKKAAQEFHQSQERAASALLDAACTSRPASQPARAICSQSKPISGAQP